MILCLQAMVVVSLFSTALDLSERLVPTENPSSTVATIFCQPSAHWHVFCTVVRELFADSRESRTLSRAAHGKKVPFNLQLWWYSPMLKHTHMYVFTTKNDPSISGHEKMCQGSAPGASAAVASLSSEICSWKTKLEHHRAPKNWMPLVEIKLMQGCAQHPRLGETGGKKKGKTASFPPSWWLSFIYL